MNRSNCRLEVKIMYRITYCGMPQIFIPAFYQCFIPLAPILVFEQNDKPFLIKPGCEPGSMITHQRHQRVGLRKICLWVFCKQQGESDRKSTRLNSSHVSES